MTWSTPPSFAASTMVTSTQLNILSADLNETAVAKATTSGGYSVSTGVNALAERIIGFATVGTSVTHTNTAFSDLTASVGPTVTVTCGARCIGMHSSKLENNTVGSYSSSALDISGATTFSPTDGLALSFTSSTANAHLRASYVVVYEMTAGSNTFQMKYRVSGNTGTFEHRRLTVIPY